MKDGTLSVFSGTVVMVTTMMGAGTIFMPSAVMNLGCHNFIAVFGVFSLASFMTLYMISYVADEYSETTAKNNISYYSVTTKYSKILAAVVDVALIIQGTGSCVLYMASIAKWFFLLFNLKEPQMWMYVLVIISFSILATLVAVKKDLSALKYVQYLSILSILYLLALCVFYSITLPSENQTKRIVMENTMKNPYLGISAFVFAISCHQNIVQVYSELRNKTMAKITQVSVGCILIGFTIYSLIGYFGYKLVGNDIEKYSILEFMFLKDKNFVQRLVSENKSNIPVKIGGVAFIIVMLCAYPMQMHPVRNGFLNLTTLNYRFRQIINEKKEAWRIWVTLFFCSLVTLLTSLMVTKKDAMDIILSFVAATAGSATIFIIPAILYVMCRKVVSVMTILALLIAGMGFVLSGYLISKIKLN